MKLKGNIAEMLRKQKKHISFHTPGHKRAGLDITELSYSDNLSAPAGVIARAEEDIAKAAGAARAFLITDGSTCGVHALLYALARSGGKSVAYSAFSHPSVKNGCRLAGLREVEIPVKEEKEIPLQPTVEQMEQALKEADALLLTSPDYYGNIPDLAAARAMCNRMGKLLLIDGAHGSHLRFGEQYAGKYADLWVDGAHKSMPAFTQGAAAFAVSDGWAEFLRQALLIFRTSSPSYPIMASVEHAYKIGRNKKIEEYARQMKKRVKAYDNADWSKIVIPFGKYAEGAQNYLQAHKVYPEFNDGSYLMFYLSPSTKKKHLKKLEKLLKKLPRAEVQTEKYVRGEITGEAEWIPLKDCARRVCAKECGLFPPCIPLLRDGEKISRRKRDKLLNAKSAFGLKEGKILVYKEIKDSKESKAEEAVKTEDVGETQQNGEVEKEN